MASFAATRTDTESRATATVAAGGKAWAWFGLISSILGLFVTWSVQFLSSQHALKSGGQTLVDDLKSGNTEVIYHSRPVSASSSSPHSSSSPSASTGT